MFISQIDIAGIKVEALDSSLHAQVAITADSSRVLVDCQISTDPIEPATRRSALMHEYRSGKRQIHIAEGLLACHMRSAALGFQQTRRPDRLSGLEQAECLVHVINHP